MPAILHPLSNKFLQATITNYGARITSLITNDRYGKPVDVVAGFATVDDYVNASSPYYGATIGRFANRIAKGQFSLHGVNYQLPINNGPNSLHGGSGFHSKVWDVIYAFQDTIKMKYVSPDMEDGYPGKMTVSVTFTLIDNTLQIEYEANTDKDTIINLTNHAFFNLNGVGNGNIMGHTVQINADSFTPVDQNLIPTGQLLGVDAFNGIFDFRTPKAIGKDFSDTGDQLEFTKGYDHNYVLRDTRYNVTSLAAKAVGNISHISMETHTTEPGMQFYTGNFMNGANTFKGGAKDEPRTCFCFETQHYPNSPNQPNFPPTLLQHKDTFRSVTQYKFGVEKP